MTTCYSWPLIVGRPFSACQKKTSTQEGETGIIPPALEGLTELIEELHQGNPVDIDGDGFQELFYEELDEQIKKWFLKHRDIFTEIDFNDSRTPLLSSRMNIGRALS